MKTAIVYYSKHHENTLKLLKAIQAEYPEVELIDASGCESLSGYDMIGFASGIYYSGFHKSVLRIAREKLPEGQKTFFVYTYGVKKEGYTRSTAEAAGANGAKILGEYGAYGFNTFGPFKLIGGIAKGRPNEQELAGAAAFYGDLKKKAD